MKPDTCRQYTLRLLVRTLAVLLVFVYFKAASAGTTLELLVPTTPSTDFSVAVSMAISNTTNAKFLANTTIMPYRVTSDLISQIQTKINGLSNGSSLLILGPGTTEEALALDASITNSRGRALFLSPSVSTIQHYTNIDLFGACLPDSERIEHLGKNAPKQWKQMSAVFVGEDGSWGLQLYTNLCAQTNSFTVRSPGLYVHTQDQGSESDYDKIATHCVEDNVNLIFLAVGDPQNVKHFLMALRDKGSGFHAFRPCVCLLGDYQFADGDMNSSTNDPQVITMDFGTIASIVMASEAQMNHEGTDLFVDLDMDVLTILADLNAKVDGNPQDFFSEIRTAFGTTATIKPFSSSFLNSSVSSSHYLRHRFELDNASQSGVNLKWLESPLVGKPFWRLLTPKIAGTTYYRDVARSKVPWLANWWLICLVISAICLGWVVELGKRYIFLQKSFASLARRCLLWFLIIVATFMAIFGLCWTGFINPASFKWVLAACISPMALLPMLQHLAFTKIPSLDKFLELPSNWIEQGLDRCINSRAAQDCAHEKTFIDLELSKADPAGTNTEELLLNWWIVHLQLIPSGEKAKKVTMRFLPNLRLWDSTFSPKEREKQLKNALVYTRVILATRDDDLPSLTPACSTPKAAPIV
ncbi:MAG: hypothetical protein JWR26_4729 [Pedosphaera sp.]|nr:hypothetical protein [Pedosphaera sp.]